MVDSLEPSPSQDSKSALRFCCTDAQSMKCLSDGGICNGIPSSCSVIMLLNKIHQRVTIFFSQSWVQFFSVFYYIFRHHFCHLYFTFYFCPPIWRCLDHYWKHKQVHLNTHTWSTCMVSAHNPILNSAWKHPDFFLNMDAKEYKIKDTGKQQTLNFTSLLSRNHSNSFYIYIARASHSYFFHLAPPYHLP